MEQGKCKHEGCGKATKPMRSGGFFDYCWEHKQQQVTQTIASNTPIATMKDIASSFKAAFDEINLLAPTMPPELKVQVAIHLNDEYYKNRRTPR